MQVFPNVEVLVNRAEIGLFYNLNEDYAMLTSFLMILCSVFFCTTLYWRKKFKILAQQYSVSDDLLDKIKFFAKLGLWMPRTQSTRSGWFIAVTVPGNLRSLQDLQISCSGFDEILSLEEALEREFMVMEDIESMVQQAIERYRANGSWEYQGTVNLFDQVRT